MKIAVVMGGDSAEREVSLKTGKAVTNGLQNNGHEVQGFDFRQADFSPIFAELLSKRFDIIFNALHGGYGENGTLQAAFNMARLPNTGSGPLASALAMDKNLAKILFRRAGVTTADWILATSLNNALVDQKKELTALGWPLAIKPNTQGSSVGFTTAKNIDELPAALEQAFQYDPEVMIETYIPGRELTVAVLGDRALPVVEIKPSHGVYDYECKYTKGKSNYQSPAEIPAQVEKEVKAQAVRAFQCLKCSVYSRIDFRLDPDHRLFCLEVNTLPGMTELSLVPMAAKAAGMSFEQLVREIVDLSLKSKSSH
jgi:D-alanine-D-alanine ligase